MNVGGLLMALFMDTMKTGGIKAFRGITSLPKYKSNFGSIVYPS